MKFKNLLHPAYLAMPLMLWAGMLVAISMEAVVKFNAPLVTLEIGVDVGRQVFPALMQAEWILAFIIMGLLLFSNQAFNSRGFLASLVITICCLLIQQFITLPELMYQAEQLIAGQPYHPGHTHIWYVLLSKTKVIALFIAAYLCVKARHESPPASSKPSTTKPQEQTCNI